MMVTQCEIFKPKPPCFYDSKENIPHLVRHSRNISPKSSLTYFVSLETLGSLLKIKREFCGFEQSLDKQHEFKQMRSSSVREEKMRGLKINVITVLSLCPCLSIITWLVWKMPRLCLQLVRLSSHSSLRMLIRGSSTIRLNPGDQCEYLRTDCRLTDSRRSVLTDECPLTQTQQY